MKFIALAMACALCLSASATVAQDDTVFRLESFLNELGYPPGAIDGAVDAQTNAAISAYQADRNLPVTGGMTLADFQALEQEIVRHRAAQATGGAPPPSTVATAPQGAPQPGMTRTVSPQGIVHHRMAQCGAHRGVGIVDYVIQGHPLVAISELSDICLDPSALTLTGVESGDGFTLVRTDEYSRYYEVLGRDDRQRQRDSLQLTDHRSETDNTLLATDIFYQSRAPERSRAHANATYSVSGFAVPSVFNPLTAPEPFVLNVGVGFTTPLPVQSDTLCRTEQNQFTNSRPAVLVLTGEIDIRAPATVALAETEGEHRNTQVQLSLTPTADGTLTGTFTASFDSDRLAGHTDCEWVRTEVEVDTIAGLTSGQAGNYFQAAGLGKSVAIARNGTRYPLVTRVLIQGWRKSMAPELD